MIVNASSRSSDETVVLFWESQGRKARDSHLFRMPQIGDRPHASSRYGCLPDRLALRAVHNSYAPAERFSLGDGRGRCEGTWHWRALTQPSPGVLGEGESAESLRKTE